MSAVGAAIKRGTAPALPARCLAQPQPRASSASPVMSGAAADEAPSSPPAARKQPSATHGQPPARMPSKRRRISRRDREEEEELLKERLCEHEGRTRDAVAGPFGLHVKTVQVKGRGVFTEKAIATGEFVIEYRGSMLTGVALAARELEYAELAGTSQDPGCYMFYFLHEGTLHCVDGTHDRGHDGVARLMNHSRRAPNLRAAKVVDHLHRPHLCLYALRDLAPGEELLFDYGERDKVAIAAFPWLDST